MKNKAGILALAFCVFLCIDAGSQEKLQVWSFTDELGEIINGYYKNAHPNVTVDYSHIPTENFPYKLDPVLAAGKGAPDIFALESSLVRKYVESGQLLDITDVYEANKDKLLAYPVEIGAHDGRVYALSWQACPGAMFYRRSLAVKYLGTDDPQVVQNYFYDMSEFLKTAELIKQRSNGACVIVSSLGDLALPVYGARRQPWIVNNKLYIDPAADEYLDLCKILHDDRLEGRVGQWSEGWFAGMKGELGDENWNQLEVFSYFLPTWGLHYVLKPNAYNTSGDWAMIPGPVPYYWGGTWVGAWKDTKNPAAAKEFIRYITTDDPFLEKWARDTGDLVPNLNVINKIKDNYAEPFIRGQNHYAEFAEMAKNVNGKLTQPTDYIIQDLFAEARDAYIRGEKTKRQVLADFREEVETILGL